MTGWPPCILLFSVTLCLASCGRGKQEENNQFAEILEKPPFGILTDSIRRFPQDADLYLRRAALLTQTNNHSVARMDYARAWSLKPSEETGYRYAANLSILGMNKERLALLQDCIRKFPGTPDFNRLMGETYADLGDARQALALYQLMLDKDSTDFETWYEKGLLMETLADTPAALEALRKAYALRPIDTYGLELAHLLAESGNSLSLSICDKILGEDMEHEMVDPFFIKGIYYSNTAQFGLAMVQYDSCIRRDWTFIDAYIEKGIIYFRQKKYDEALNTFRMATTVSNTNADAYYWMGRCYEVQQKKDDAIVQYQRALALERQFPEAREALRRLQP